VPPVDETELRGLDDPEELVDEPGLADARDAHEGDELGLPLDLRPLERVNEDAELALAPDQGGAVQALDCNPGARLECPPYRERLCLAPRLDGIVLGVVDAVAGRRWVVASASTPPVGAAVWSRLAVLTTSPAASGSPPIVTNASPVLTPIRSSIPCSSAQSRIASAARTARSGSSSCATGAPKMAITASPMNFSTVPPKRSSSPRTCSW
jgi:hypothetical protein